MFSAFGVPFWLSVFILGLNQCWNCYRIFVMLYTQFFLWNYYGPFAFSMVIQRSYLLPAVGIRASCSCYLNTAQTKNSKTRCKRSTSSLCMHVGYGLSHIDFLFSIHEQLLSGDTTATVFVTCFSCSCLWPTCIQIGHTALTNATCKEAAELLLKSGANLHHETKATWGPGVVGGRKCDV